MVNLQLSELVYGLLGLPEEVGLEDASAEDLEAAVEHLKGLQITGPDFLDLLRDWVAGVADTVDPTEKEFIDIISDKLDDIKDSLLEPETPEGVEELDTDEVEGDDEEIEDTENEESNERRSYRRL